MKYLKELHSDTYKRAAEKAKEYGQENLAKSFDEWSWKMSWEEKKQKNIILRERDKYSFDMYFDKILFSESEYHKVNDVLNVNIDGFNGDFFDGDGYSVIWYLDKKDEERFKEHEDDFLLQRLDIMVNDNGDLVIVDSASVKNKFSNKREALKFVKFLETMYKLESPKFMNYKKKLNDLDVTDKDKSGPFYKFINRNFGSFDEFKSKIQLRKLYDRYDR